VSALYRLPLGLLGFFGIKDQGEYPSAVAKTISPTLEMLEWLARANANTFITDSTAVYTTNGQKRTSGGLWIVPAGEAWLLNGCTGQTTVAAGLQLQARLGIGRISGAAVNLHTTGKSELIKVETTAWSTAACSPGLNGPKLMFPGDEVVMDVLSATPVAGNFQTFINGYVLKFQL